MSHFDDLCTKLEGPTFAGREVNELRWNLSRQAEGIRRGSAMRHNSFRARCGEGFDHFFGSRSPRSETSFHGFDIHAAIKRHQLLVLLETLEGLIHSRTTSKVQEFPGADQSALREHLDLFQD